MIGSKYTAEELAVMQGYINDGYSYALVCKEFNKQFPETVIRKSMISGLVSRGLLKGHQKHPFIFKDRWACRPNRRTNGQFARQKPRPSPANPPLREPIMKRLPLLDLTNTSCRYVIGDPRQGAGNYFFCAAEEADVKHGEPYCQAHRAICWIGAR